MMDTIISIGLAISLGLNLYLIKRTKNMVTSERNGTQVLLKDRKGIIKTGIIRDESND
ncbi:hypothetical protein ACOKFD_15605 [Flagellimonas sp. S174]|uniref:hypothetical protein n=1 Tax=Flagellimonas sp. S174 TaxID=3410790 RepID=UPI003BF4DDDF